MKNFSGFPAGKVRSVGVPEPVFTELIPIIDDLNELKVTLHVLYRLEGQRGRTRAVRQFDLLADENLLQGLHVEEDGEAARKAALKTALARAVERGTLLQVEVEVDERPDVLYLANTPRGRASHAALRRGETLAEASSTPRPNVFVLYEQNVGPLTPLITDELKEAEQLYPADWIEAAFREAVTLNKRSWKYIRAILERWRSEGRKDEAARRDHKGDRRRYIEGEYGEYIEH